MALPKDFREFLELLNSHGVEYVIVGGFALAWHGRPRFTGDIDILIRRTPENARRTADVIEAFGFRPLRVTAEELMKEGQIVQMGLRPIRIDVITSISGVDTELVWLRRIAGEMDSIPVWFIDRESFLANKRASGRPQDLADVEELER